MRRTGWPDPMQMTWGWSLLCVAMIVLGPVAATPAAVPDRAVLAPMRATNGKAVELSAPKGGASALVFYSSECPISNAYSPTLNRIMEEFPATSLRLVGVCTDPDLSAADVAKHAKDFGLKFPVVHDKRRYPRSEARRQGDARGVRHRRPGTDPLPRPDRRPVRRAAKAERQRADPRAARRHCRRAGRAAEVRRRSRGGRLPDRQAAKVAVPTYSQRGCGDPPEELPASATAAARSVRSRWRRTPRPASAPTTSPR